MQTFNSSSYKPNSIVINENEIQDRLYIIVKGKVRVTRKFKKRKTLITRRCIWANRFIHEASLLLYIFS